ncbi:MAG: acyl-CoA dehydrogenase family protein [candidate division KSB1 bacterium]|nr:acyl-CoA dehydrogenase family protein [candidate division KSB1 bacterium]MDZ7358244.1 acyl-CoA dehydrogenase family protein [candidate division KSB1 bacterium]MDZ7376791.1 acyl-CoA dehydrogenase family protein [candidate division KSB1 bacterium]MDZ7400385.1 acyl-CoA dehydrogenase family protein [candidate division KSB1 bacterium]
MDFSIPKELESELIKFNDFIKSYLKPRLPQWQKEKSYPRTFFVELGKNGWLGFDLKNGAIIEQPYLKQALLMEALAKVSPGMAITMLVQISLGTKGLHLFGTEAQKQKYFASAIRGETLLCVGNTENLAGSDVANISARAEKVSGGWILTGAKSYVTNGAIADYAIITAVTDPDATRTRKLSLFWVDLNSPGVSRYKLNKDVWIPSDLTRIQMKQVFVPEENLMGTRGKGLSHILEIFTNSRITISALALGTAVGAFELGLERAKKRDVFGQKIADLQAKSFEIADFYARIEAARMMLYRACWVKDQLQQDFRLEASLAKYLTVDIAKRVSNWAADLFGAASVVIEHPIHKFPLDAWAVALGEGTQDVQKLIIFREVMKRQGQMD